MSDGYKTYHIWRQQLPDNRWPGPWFKTAHTVEARTDDEARRKMARSFSKCGFHAMNLVAVPEGGTP